MAETTIPKKLWYIQHSARKLSYATHCEKVDAAFKKRVQTGLSWAKVTGDENTGTFLDNKPVSGWEFLKVNSRYVTNNKLIQVRSPYGFEFEIPTENLLTLCQQATISMGVVTSPCVLGKKGSNWELLSIESDVYKRAAEVTDKLENGLFKFKDLEVGQLFKVYNSDSQFVYFGKYKVSYELSRVNFEKGGRWYGGDVVNCFMDVDPSVKFTSKYVHMYMTYGSDSTYVHTTTSDLKILEAGEKTGLNLDAIHFEKPLDVGMFTNLVASQVSKFVEDLPTDFKHTRKFVKSGGGSVSAYDLQSVNYYHYGTLRELKNLEIIKK